jgi:DNA helicase II / ATP-dependent DNA helicase PcrA
MKPIAPGTPAREIVDEEVRILGRVTSALSRLSSRIDGAPDFDAALVNLRDQVAEAKPEDVPALVDQMMRISAIAQRYGKGRDLPVNPRTPYFAHLRLEDDEKRRDILIGKHGFVDRDREVQIVDWRHAPVSRIYYRYEEGDDFEERFGDRVIEGIVEARRSLTIEDTRLQRIGCPQGTLIVGEGGAWFEADPVSLSVLSGGQGTATRPPALRPGPRGSRLGVHSGPELRADKHLPEIAALIDAVQFELIIRPESGLVVLQGGAGSGKTTVALHRIAYLNFALPGRFRADRILVVVPSEAMVRYVERVLPSLGVSGVQITTASAWFRRVRRRIVPAAPDVYSDEAPAVVPRLKKHPMLLTVMRELVASQVARADAELERVLAPLEGGPGVLATWRGLAAEPPIPRLARLKAALREVDLPALTLQEALVTARRLGRRVRDLMADWGEIFTDRGLLEEAASRLCPGEFTAKEIDRVCAWCSAQLDEVPLPSPPADERPRPFARPLEEGLSEDSFLALDGQDEAVGPTSGRLDPADDALLLSLALLKGGRLRPAGGKPIQHEHIVVDEAQDLSCHELAVLVGCATRARSVTLAGDTAQRMAFDNAFAGWTPLLEQLGLAAVENQTLALGYRSTQEIMELAHRLVGDSPLYTGVRSVRSGAPVELHRFGDQGEAVALLAEALRSLALREPLASVAIVARHLEQARSYASALASAEVPGVRLIAEQEFSFKAGTEVTDVSQVKGLEFDYVILLDVTAANYPDTVESRHLLYIAATRAAHQLWLVCVGPPSPILPPDLLGTP